MQRTAARPKLRERLTPSQRRESILRAAITLFARRGYHGVTTRALAEAAGVSEPILYRHFPAKHDLYSAIIEHKAQAGIAELEQALRVHAERRNDRGFFLELGRFVLSQYRRDPSYVRLLLFSALEGHELAQMFFDRQIVAHYKQVSGYLRARMREGALREVAPNLAARAFLGMVNHHALVGLLFRDRIVRASAETVLQGFVEAFLKGMEKK
ncbi:MAG: TetR/AcrR family transcriptional regulator [Burkholderiales bacterium]